MFLNISFSFHFVFITFLWLNSFMFHHLSVQCLYVPWKMLNDSVIIYLCIFFFLQLILSNPMERKKEEKQVSECVKVQFQLTLFPSWKKKNNNKKSVHVYINNLTGSDLTHMLAWSPAPFTLPSPNPQIWNALWHD